MSERQTQAAPVAVPATTDTPEALALARQLQDVQHVRAHATTRLRELETQAQTHLLTADEETEQLILTQRLVNTEGMLANLSACLSLAKAQVDVEQIKAHHDSRIAAKRAHYDHIAQLVADLFAAFAALARDHDEQVQPLLALTRHDGTPAIPTRSGSEVVQDVISRMPQAHAWQMALLAPTSRALTNGDMHGMLDADPGLVPLSPHIIERYLEGLKHG